MPTKAVYIGMNTDDEPDGVANPLRVDCDGAGTLTTTSGLQNMVFARDWTGPQVQTFNNPYADYEFEKPVVQMEVYRKPAADPAVGMSRDRSGGWTGVCATGDYSAGTMGYGMNYIKATITQVKPSTEYKVIVWGMEARGIWACRTDNPDSKYAVWATTNPKQWPMTMAGAKVEQILHVLKAAMAQ